ncbi:MAG TPA: hypothetical protein VKR06_31060 [Ktedonosporobacter sp.]|nr:hypothetical protein [Ktedonosporobacter sp.]
MRVPKIVAISLRIYQCLLSLGPAEFRRDYSFLITQVFRQNCLDAYQQRGVYGVLSLWLPLFSEVITGMLEEHSTALLSSKLTLYRRMILMLRTRRRSMVVIFCAFVLFGLPWVFFQSLIDPLSQWNPIAQAHPEIDAIFSIVRIAGEVAFLMMIICGVPIVLSAIKHALIDRRRDVLVLIGLATLMGFIFAIEVAVLLINPQGWSSFDHNGGIFAVTGMIALLVITVALSVAVARSTPSARVLRFALMPATLETLAMAVALIAAIVEDILLPQVAPQIFSGIQPINIATVTMALATVLATIALWSGMRARTLTTA